MTIQVLGSGCQTCKKLYELTKQAVAELDLDSRVEYIAGPQGIQEIIALGAMSSPVLVINGQLAMAGSTSDINKIKALISAKK